MTDQTATRVKRTAMIRVLAEDVRRKRLILDTAIARRDEALIEAHGDKREGYLSYQELADASGMSKGRVIQVVQESSDD